MRLLVSKRRASRALSGAHDQHYEPDMVVTRKRAAGGPATVSVATLLSWGERELTKQGIAAIESRWLLEWALEQPSLALAPQTAGIRAAEKYRSAVAQRKARVPLQHITGSMQFRYLTLKAGRGVFTVRPETELLVELALDCLPAGPRTVADLCAGSGAIGIALATERADTQVTLVEAQGQAMRYLRANVARYLPLDNGSGLVLVQADATRALPGDENTFDLVISNPPYVGLADAPVQPEALADPPTALYGGGEDGLVTPRGIVTRSFALLRPGGTLLLEHGESQGPALREHARHAGYVDCETKYDLAGKPRFLMAWKPHAEED